MKKGSVTMNINKLKKLYESLGTVPHIEVGVFQSKTARKEKGLTNAGLAEIHEYGSPEHNIPRRSMLKVPLADHAREIMEPFKGKATAFLAKSTLMNLYKLVGIAGEKIVLGAFSSGGYGKWVPLKYSTLLAKLNRGKNGVSLKTRKGKLAQIYAGLVGEGILIDSGQLRRAFSSRVRMAFR